MFGLSFGEILLLLVVGIVVVGPRRLPALMRTAGQWIARLRRMSVDLRAQSGIDDLIRHEGLEKEIRELRSLSRVNVIDSLMSPMMGAAARSYGAPSAPEPASPPPLEAAAPRPAEPPRVEPLREREYPLLGCDSYGALPEDDEPYPPDDDTYADAPEAGEIAPDAPVGADDAEVTAEDPGSAMASEGAVGATEATAAPEADEAVATLHGGPAGAGAPDVPAAPAPSERGP